MEKTGPVKFAREVRLEAAKVTWPARKETMVTTGMIFLMAFVSAIFLFLVDLILGQAIRAVLGLGG